VIGAGTEEHAQFDATFSHTHIVEIEQRRIEHAHLITCPDAHPTRSVPLI
jgi:hypothetical protein